MPAGRVFRQLRAQFQQRDVFTESSIVDITGTLAETLDNATSAASGASGGAGTTAVTLANLTSAAAGATGATGTVNATLANITSAAAGTFSPTGTVSVTLADTTSTAAGTSVDATPEPPPLVPSLPMPRIGGTGRTVRLKLTARLGSIQAHTAADVEFADEELVALL